MPAPRARDSGQIPRAEVWRWSWFAWNTQAAVESAHKASGIGGSHAGEEASLMFPETPGPSDHTDQDRQKSDVGHPWIIDGLHIEDRGTSCRTRDRIQARWLSGLRFLIAPPRVRGQEEVWPTRWDAGQADACIVLPSHRPACARQNRCIRRVRPQDASRSAAGASRS